MKITGPRPTEQTSAARRKGGSSSSGDGFSIETPQSARAAVATSSASALGSVDALLALQSVGDFREAKKRATERAMSLLDVLDDLKLALLEGGVPRQRLVALMDILKSRRDETQDPRLEAMLDEVEVRAAVELAKYDA
ncbi:MULTISPECIES: flagellar assembly protein FliX [Hyphobacterium]|uniref:Flagellar assembly protein FliX n=1 Tax=Hyphobacterium vulgare TaxID=1736751 RepID=A0ABV7A0C3_9PROT